MTVGRHTARTADDDPVTEKFPRVEEVPEPVAPIAPVEPGEPVEPVQPVEPVAARAPVAAPAPPDLVLLGGTGAVRVALGFAGVLILAHFVALAVGIGRPGFEIPQAIRLGAGANIATWFGSALHLVNAGLLALIAATSLRRERVRWALLSAVVLVVSVDEVSANHEQVGYDLHTMLGTSGALTHAWIIPAVVLVAAVAALCGRMVLSRPGGRLVALAAAIFVVGALGVEAVEGWWFGATGAADDPVHLVLGGLEEAMEMIGVIVAMAGLLRMAGGSGLRLVSPRG